LAWFARLSNGLSRSRGVAAGIRWPPRVPAVANGLIYMGDTGDHVDAFDASDGSRLWDYTTGSAIDFSSPAVSNGLVTIGSDDGTVYGFGLAGGIAAVKRPAPAQLHPNRALFPSRDGNSAPLARCQTAPITWAA
jgi:outer membrane protein assembly factor BamB